MGPLNNLGPVLGPVSVTNPAATLQSGQLSCVGVVYIVYFTMVILMAAISYASLEAGASMRYEQGVFHPVKLWVFLGSPGAPQKCK